MIQTFKVMSNSGIIHQPIPWLTADELQELNIIGYTGLNSNKERTTREKYLNSLNKGQFKIEILHSDTSEWSEQLLIIRECDQLSDSIGVYLSDSMYLPIQYKDTLVELPHYNGKGNHSIASLEALCEQFKEYCHQQAIIKQNCMKHIVELKFNIKI